MTTFTIPREFVWRRLHSLMGLWLVLFLSEHLLTNSQAALWLGEEGRGFVRLVNGLHNLPYLEVLELTLLGIPLLIHLVWGVRYALSSKSNSGKSDGSTPSIRTGRNRAYSWQRITSWILLFCLVGHVVKFRFLEYPAERLVGSSSYYVVTVTPDEKLSQLAKRLDVALHDQSSPFPGAAALHEGEILAAAPDFGSASLLVVRDTFKNPIYIALYTLFVLVACFHAFNGFWTFLITWGLILKASAQRAWTSVALCLMIVFICLGLAAIWGR